MTGYSGRSLARVVQRRMLELPMKRMAALGGGFVLSPASKASISFSKGLVAADAAKVNANRRASLGSNRIWRLKQSPARAQRWNGTSIHRVQLIVRVAPGLV